MRKKEYPKNEKNPVIAVCIGVGISIAVAFAGALIISLLIMNERISEGVIGYGILAVIMIASLSGACATIMIYKKKLLMMSLSASVAFTLVLLSLTALFFGGQYRGVPVTFLVIMCGGICATLFEGRRISHAKSYRKKFKL